MNTFFFDDVQYPEGLFGGKDFFNPIIYSTEEREVGVWTDNKPLYQKTIHIPNVTKSSWSSYSFGIENAIVHDLKGYVLTNNGVKWAINYYQSNTFFSVYFSNSSVTIYWNYGNASSAEADVTILYTKTTDVAGSGEYNTLGIPNVHYDGNEKIIGTWFGETLYERTFNGLATNTNGDNWVNIGGIDASTWKDAVNVEIYCNSSDVNNKLTRIALSEARVFNGNVQVTTSVSYNREINVATIQYTKTS